MLCKCLAKPLTAPCASIEITCMLSSSGPDNGFDPETCFLPGTGVQATIVFKQTKEYFKPLYRQLKQRRVVKEMVAGVAIMVQNIKDRNYLAAYDMYMRLAIGAILVSPFSLAPSTSCARTHTPGCACVHAGVRARM